MKFYILNMGLYGSQIWTHRKVDQEYLGSFEV